MFQLWKTDKRMRYLGTTYPDSLSLAKMWASHLMHSSHHYPSRYGHHRIFGLISFVFCAIFSINEGQEVTRIDIIKVITDLNSRNSVNCGSTETGQISEFDKEDILYSVEVF